MTAITRRLALALLLAPLAACVSKRAPRSTEPATYVEVQNQSWLDQTIYVMRSSQRVRIGQVTGNSRARLRIPAGMLFGATPLRFVADPVGSSRQATSLEITVSPGEDVTLTIPPS